MGLFRKAQPKTREDIIAAIQQEANVGSSINATTVQGQKQAFENCAAVTTVVNKHATYIRQFRLWQVSHQGEEVGGDAYIKQLSHPNAYQSIFDFVAAVETNIKVYGEALIWIDRENGDDLYLLPNSTVSQVTTMRQVWTKPHGNVVAYDVSVSGTIVRLPVDDVEVISDANPDLTKIAVGKSRLCALSDCINAYINAYSASAEVIANRGPLGIVSMTAPDANVAILADDSVKDAERKLQGNYGVLRNRFRYITTSLSASFVPITCNISELNLDGTRKDCSAAIASIYQVPTVLISSEGTTFANLNTAGRDFYQNVIIPDAVSIFEVLNRIRGFVAVKVMPYFDHLQCFQEQRKDSAQAMASYLSALHTAFVDGVIDVEEYKQRLTKFEIE